jgi:hypothetical protein
VFSGVVGDVKQSTNKKIEEVMKKYPYISKMIKSEVRNEIALQNLKRKEDLK